MLRWFEQNGPEGDVVISSRVRLARNLKDYNFSLKLDTPDAHKMIGEAAQKLRVLPEFKDFHGRSPARSNERTSCHQSVFIKSERRRRICIIE